MKNEDYRTSKDWLRFRKHWLERHPPLDNHCYLCGICARWVPADEVTLDHIHPRTAENLFLDSNLQPSHGYCNYMKGSKRWKPKVTKTEYDFLDLLSKM